MKSWAQAWGLAMYWTAATVLPDPTEVDTAYSGFMVMPLSASQ